MRLHEIVELKIDFSSLGATKCDHSERVVWFITENELLSAPSPVCIQWHCPLTQTVLFIKLLLVCVIFVICMDFLFPFSKITNLFVVSVFYLLAAFFLKNDNKHINGTVTIQSHMSSP